MEFAGTIEYLNISDVNERTVNTSIFPPLPPPIQLSYNAAHKLTVAGAEAGATSTVIFDGTEYPIGTETEVVIDAPGKYDVVVKGATSFSMSSEIVEYVPTPLSVEPSFTSSITGISALTGASTVTGVSMGFPGFAQLSVTPTGTSLSGGWGYAVEHSANVAGDLLRRL